MRNFKKKVVDYFNTNQPTGSNKILVWFLGSFTLIGFIIAWATGILTDEISASTWIIIGLAAIGLWMAFGGGTGVSAGSVSQIGKSWLMPIVIAVAVLMVTAEVFPLWWENATWVTIFLIAAFIVLLFMMKKNRTEGRIFIVAGLVLLFLKPGCQSFGGKNGTEAKIDKETQRVLAAQEAGKRSGIVEIDTTIDFDGKTKFVFDLGYYMSYDIREITTGEGFWYEEEGVINFKIPSGKTFVVDEEGHAVCPYDSTASPKGISSGPIEVWGIGTAKIKTFWKDPKYVTASK